jgi:hypothetical protein
MFYLVIVSEYKYELKQIAIYSNLKSYQTVGHILEEIEFEIYIKYFFAHFLNSKHLFQKPVHIFKVKQDRL